MNVLEALKVVESGGYIRHEDDRGNVIFVMQSVLIPIGERSVIRINLEDFLQCKRYPSDLSGVEYEEVDDVCISSIRSEEYVEISYDEMMEEVQREWKKVN